jgi:hypothetical protein
MVAANSPQSPDGGDEKRALDSMSRALFLSWCRDQPASAASSRIATMLMILIIGLMAGPAVSL